MCVHVQMDMCKDAYMCTRVCVHMWEPRCARGHVHMYVFLFLCVGILCRRACVCIRVYMFIICADGYMCVDMCACMCVCVSVVDVGCFLQLLSSLVV